MNSASDDPKPATGKPAPEEVRKQLERLRLSAPLKSSPRCIRFLEYVIEETLAGRKENLKERSVAITAFKRPPTYDSDTDPVVRQTASEVRKRLAQYYMESGGQDSVRIEIPRGSYAPEFRRVEIETPARRPPWRRLLKFGLPSLAGLAVIVAVFAAARRSESPLETLWTPFLKRDTPVLLCVGDSRPVSTAAASSGGIVEGDTQVHTDDAITMARLGGFLGSHHTSVFLRYAPRVAFDELRENPAVLIGAFNNYWTLKLTDPLRFRVARSGDDGRDIWIEDSADPGKRKWRVTVPPDGKVPVDYAIVTRAIDHGTGRPSIVLAGLTHHGTLAAGEFLTDPQYMRKALSMFPKGWETKNVQMVLMTHIIAGSNGPPTVVAVHTW
jgi:hypothetical protein